MVLGSHTRVSEADACRTVAGSDECSCLAYKGGKHTKAITVDNERFLLQKFYFDESYPKYVVHTLIPKTPNPKSIHPRPHYQCPAKDPLALRTAHTRHRTRISLHLFAGNGASMAVDELDKATALPV